MSQAPSKTKAWIHAFRLRTLPLALSGISMGSFLAAFDGTFSWGIFILATITALFLQILSNLANDYGDSVKGTDGDGRIGPERAVQSGLISLQEMRIAIIIFSILALLPGLWLIKEGTEGLDIGVSFVFLLLGILAIIAAIKYTVGSNPYGYAGLGDLFVFIFFGLTAVAGTYYLHTHQFSWDVLLPASSLGLLSAGVLNLNNMRDRENDQLNNKNTLVVKLGGNNAKLYHAFLLITAIILALGYTAVNYHSPIQLLFLFAVPLILMNLRTVWQNREPKLLDPLLKKLALSTVFFVLTFGIGLIFSV